MTTEQVAALGPAFAAYLRPFGDCFVNEHSRQHLETYCRGLLSDLPRKSVEPIALAAGTAVRTLQEFLRDHVWDQERMRTRFQQRLAQQSPPADADDLGRIGIIDETGTAKKGTETPGVQRQWCGRLGKTENCIVTVHLGLAQGPSKVLVDADLYLPQSWAEDRERCRKASIPETLTYRPKWRIALEQLDRARTNGLLFAWLTFDEYYGSKPGFWAELAKHPETIAIGEVPKSFRCLTRRPGGQMPKGGWKGKRVDRLARHSAVFHQQSWQEVQLARLTLDAQVWSVRAAQVYLLHNGQPSERTYWLIVAENTTTGEVKYFVSNAPAATPLERLLRVGFRRARIEHTFRVAKTEIGFSHFEGRSYKALLRHLILCLVVLGFASERTDRLREKKSGGDLGASVPSAEPTVCRVAGESASHDPFGTYSRGHCLSPAA